MLNDILKKRLAKDRRQAQQVWAAVRDRMPHYPVDEDFRAELPETLRPVFAQLLETSA